MPWRSGRVENRRYRATPSVLDGGVLSLTRSSPRAVAQWITVLPSRRLEIRRAARSDAVCSDADAALMPSCRAMSPVVCSVRSRRSTAARVAARQSDSAPTRILSVAGAG
jgi:hypothetical protein